MPRDLPLGGARVRLGFEQYKAIEHLYEAGSPVTIGFLEPTDEIHGEAIEELYVTYFVNETDRQDFVLTPEGDLIEPEQWRDAGYVEADLDSLEILKTYVPRDEPHHVATLQRAIDRLKEAEV